jgi:hypothetical protein
MTGNDSSKLDKSGLDVALGIQEKRVLDNYSGVKGIFDECSILIAKARDLIAKPDRIGEARDTLFKLEARINAADESRNMLCKKRYCLWIGLWNLPFLAIALFIGWLAVDGLYTSCKAGDNAAPAAVVAPVGQNPAQNGAATAIPLSFGYYLLLGCSAGIFGGVTISIFGLVKHGIQGDFAKAYIPWYVYKPVKGGLAGAVSVLPFIAGLAAFQIDFKTQIQTTIAFISLASFLIGYCERYFLQLLDTVGTVIFKPADNAGSGSSKEVKTS